MGCGSSTSKPPPSQPAAAAPPPADAPPDKKNTEPEPLHVIPFRRGVKQDVAPTSTKIASLRASLQDPAPIVDSATFHQFVQVYEFPIHFDGWTAQTLAFQGTTSLIADAFPTPEYFRFIPVDVNDATKGYYLYSSLQRIYAANKWGDWQTYGCIPGTNVMTAACIFFPEFISATVLNFRCPGFPSDAPDNPAWPWNPLFVRRTDMTQTPITVRSKDVMDSFTPNVAVPTSATSRPINSQDLQFHEWHTFFLFHEFPLYFSDSPTTPLTFSNGDTWNSGPVIIGSHDNSNPQLLQLVPKDAFDYTQGYYLFNRALRRAAGNRSNRYFQSACIPSTIVPTEAVLFQVMPQSTGVIKLAAPGYAYSDPGAPPLAAPTFVLRMGGGDEAAWITEDNAPGFWNKINLPTTGTLLPSMDHTYAPWHHFFRSSNFPLRFASGGGTNPAQPSGPGASAFFIQGTVDVHCNLIPLDTEDYTKGYHIAFSSGQYVGGGTGTYNGAPCVKLVMDVSNADVFLVRVTTGLNFVLLNLQTYQALTLSAVTGSTNIVYTSTMGASASDVAHRTLTLPSWAVRIMRMAYLSPASVFTLRTNNTAAYVSLQGSTLQLTSTVPAASSSQAYVTPMDLSVLHSGYLINIGGKYVKLTAVNEPVTMVETIADASPFCIVRESKTTPNYSLWVCDTDFVLSPSTNGAGVCFVLQTNPWAVPPTWTLGRPSAPTLNDSHVQNTTTTSSIGTTTYLKSVFDELTNSHYSDRGQSWNVSFDNQLPSDFFVATPADVFGDYADMPMAAIQPTYPPPATANANQKRANDYFMVLKQASDAPGPANAPVTQIQSSARFPGDTKIYLAAGHSAVLFESMYQVIVSGNHVVDIMSLGRFPEDYEAFMAALRNAVTYVSCKSGAENIQLRLFFGAPPSETAVPVTTALQLLTRDVGAIGTSAGASRMTIWFAWAVNGLRWNHAKFVAADGNSAIAGGHNMWAPTYLEDNPVVDVSMKLTGRAASDCHQFADYAWSTLMQRDLSGDGPTAVGKWTWDGASGSITTGFTSRPPDRLFMSFYADPRNWVGSSRDTGSGTPVLSIARNQDDNFGNAASEAAIVALVKAAQTTIHFSAQSFSNFSNGTTTTLVPYWSDLFDALAAALVRGVEVNMYLSPPGGDYGGDPPLDIFNNIARRVSSTPGLSEHDKGVAVDRLTVRSFPLGTHWGFAATAGIRNHAKMMMVDSKAVLIGSENFYVTTVVNLVGGLGEFGFIFEDATKAAAVVTYFSGLNGWCQASPPKPPIPPPVQAYQVRVLSLTCTALSDADSWFSSGNPDQVYLYLDDYLWPLRGAHDPTNIDTNQKLTVGTNVPGTFTNYDGQLVLQLYEADVFSTDDLLADWTFNKDMIQGKNPNTTYSAVGNMYAGTYSIEWSFSPV